ncbi:MAG: ABC transporter ATP-binding protein [Moritella sp.]|nr:ABC transporter ATP-binding protein [Moritella sp.]
MTMAIFDHDHWWLHFITHIILVLMPLMLLAILINKLISLMRQTLLLRRESRQSGNPLYHPRIPQSLSIFIKKYTLRKQLLLAGGAILTLPITFAILELPKLIINNAIDSDNYLLNKTAMSLSQIEYLLVLCGFYLMALIANGVLKFVLNYYKGCVAEGLIKRLRLLIFRRQRGQRGVNKSDFLAPVILQEVEPICAFSGDAVAVPVLQGGTALTIIGFMLLQNIALGAAVIALLPVQIIIIPIFQRRINKLVRHRLRKVRRLSKLLASEQNRPAHLAQKPIRTAFHALYVLRIQLFKTKFIMKSLNNFIMNLTPFFFYTVGGYLVIEGKLSLGALVASLASYKDLASAIRELFTYYQSLQDARTRYTEMLTYTEQPTYPQVIKAQFEMHHYP